VALYTSLSRLMSGAGQSRHFDRAPITSGLPLRTDIGSIGRHVHTTGLVCRGKSDLGQPVKWVWRIGLRAILPQAPSPAVTTSEGGDLG
jgi:hypothetical protein